MRSRDHGLLAALLPTAQALQGHVSPEDAFFLILLASAHARGLLTDTLPPSALARPWEALSAALAALSPEHRQDPALPGWFYQAWNTPQKLASSAASHDRGARGGRQKLAAPQLLDTTRLYTPAPLARWLASHTVRPAAPVLDPACGCGHLLLAALDTLLAPPTRAPEDALHDALSLLHGEDIDATGVAIARWSLWLAGWAWLRARAPHAPPPRLPPNLRAVGWASTDPRLPAGLPPWLHDAPSLATLLPGEALPSPALPFPRSALWPSPLDPAPLDPAPLDPTPPAHPSGLLDARRWPAILMNPPYAGARKLSPALRQGLLTLAGKGADLADAFVMRGWAALADGGRLGVLGPSAWLTSPSMASFRATLLAEGGPVAARALGQHVFPDAPLVFSAVVVMERSPAPTLVTERASWPHAALRALPGNPLLPRLALPTTGLQLRDLFRFQDGEAVPARLVEQQPRWWERGAHDGGHWVPWMGGGGHQRWRGVASRARWQAEPPTDAPLPSLAYPRVAGGRLCARWIDTPEKTLAGSVRLLLRPGAAPHRREEAMALLNSRIGTAWASTLGAGLNLNPGALGRFPVAASPPEEALVRSVHAALALKAQLLTRALPYPPLLHAPPPTPASLYDDVQRSLEAELSLLRLEAEIEEALLARLGMGAADRAALDAEVGPLAWVGGPKRGRERPPQGPLEDAAREAGAPAASLVYHEMDAYQPQRTQLHQRLLRDAALDALTLTLLYTAPLTAPLSPEATAARIAEACPDAPEIAALGGLRWPGGVGWALSRHVQRRFGRRGPLVWEEGAWRRVAEG